MPIELTIETNRRLVRARVAGAVTTEEILAAVDRSLDHLDDGSAFDVLSDHRGVEVPLTVDQAMALTAHLEGRAEVMTRVRWAIVTGSPASYGMMRLLSARAESIPMRVQVFEDVEAANVWLRDDERR